MKYVVLLGDGMGDYPVEALGNKIPLQAANIPAIGKIAPPHEFADKAVSKHLPAGDRQAEIRELMELSKEVFADHPVNKKRIAEGKKPATQIGLWGQGNAMQLESYQALDGLGGGGVSAVDRPKGLAKLAGLKAPDVDGATGFLDTNYQGKVDTGRAILEQDDFVFIHIEAPDECGHMGDAQKKTQAIEEFDSRVVAPVFQWLEDAGEPYTLAVVHRPSYTGCPLKEHTSEPVPMAVLRGSVGEINTQAKFDETVNNEEVQCMACDWIQEILTASSEG